MFCLTVSRLDYIFLKNNVEKEMKERSPRVSQHRKTNSEKDNQEF